MTNSVNETIEDQAKRELTRLREAAKTTGSELQQRREQYLANENNTDTPEMRELVLKTLDMMIAFTS